MKSFASRCLVLVAVSLVAACQQAPQIAAPPTDELVSAFRQLDSSLSDGQLEAAERQLASLEQRASGDTRLQQYQRQLAEAYLLRGQQALQKGDLDRATKALSQARSLMPQAPALTTGLDGAIAQARDAELDAADRAQSAAEQAAARAEAARQEQALQLRQAAASQAAAIRASELANTPAPSSRPQARLIDPSAAISLVPLPMLDKQDNESLRDLLDQVAEDVVAFRCAVHIEVRQAKDYQWVAALLNVRVKRLDPSFNPRLVQVIKPAQTPRLLLSPAQRQ